MGLPPSSPASMGPHRSKFEEQGRRKTPPPAFLPSSKARDMSKMSSSMDCVGIAVLFFFNIASQLSRSASHDTPSTWSAGSARMR